MSAIRTAKTGDELIHKYGSRWKVIGFIDRPAAILRRVEQLDIGGLDQGQVAVVIDSPWSEEWRRPTFADRPKLEQVREGTHAIEISFGAPVHVNAEHQRRLIAILNDICRAYEDRHPDRVMWTAGWGDKIDGNIFCLEDDEPIPFNGRIFAIDCAERERFEGEQH